MQEHVPVSPDIAEAFVGIWYLTHPGEYGLSDEDPKIQVIRELGPIAQEAGVKPVIIGGIAIIANGFKRQTTDVDLLVARADAMKLIRKLDAAPGWRKIRLERFKNIEHDVGVDLCVEGELTSPYHVDRFPAPSAVEQLPRDPIPVVGLIDLLALKIKSARARDQGDTVELFKIRGLGRQELEAIKARIFDPRLKALADELYVKAQEELEREKLMGPPKLE